jgi:hypothetical protein
MVPSDNGGYDRPDRDSFQVALSVNHFFSFLFYKQSLTFFR